MLKHKFIIDRLSEAQKIKILTDVRCLAEEEYAKLGIPAFKLSNVEGYRRSHFSFLFHQLIIATTLVKSV